jgi:F-type H+-transporting ATPase subunit gamma
MANDRAIKSRIKSAKNIAQITKAMEMVSAAKMKKAQAKLGSSMAYAEKLHEMMQTLSSFIDASQHPLLYVNNNPKSALIVVMTSNKGLSGALNSNVLRESSRMAREMSAKGMKVEFVSIGKKGRDFLRYTRRTIVGVFDGFGDTPKYTQVQPIAQFVIDAFLKREYDVIYFVYPKFISTLVQHATVHTMLPVALPSEEKSSEARQKPLFEPESEILLERLLPYYVEQELFQFILQSNASEHSARMIAMKNATDNAKEVRKDLTLEYNRARQAQITQQIAEIASATMI